MDYQEERWNEQSYFWVLFKPEYPELFELWAEIAAGYEELEFRDLNDLTYWLSIKAPRKYQDEPIEVFICRRVWQDKVARNSIIDPDFDRYIRSTPECKWLFEPDPRKCTSKSQVRELN
jgi:hypothetical protein